jgi:hypothetical protein
VRKAHFGSVDGAIARRLDERQDIAVGRVLDNLLESILCRRQALAAARRIGNEKLSRRRTLSAASDDSMVPRQGVFAVASRSF